jgi:hypothetical protein
VIAPVLARDSTGAVLLPMRQVGGADAVMTRLWTRLRTRRGTALEDAERGLPWTDWLQRPGVPLVEITDAVREQAALVQGVVAVVAVTGSRSGGRITIGVRVDVESDDTIASVAITVADPYQTQGAPPWYAVAPVVFAA